MDGCEFFSSLSDAEREQLKAKHAEAREHARTQRALREQSGDGSSLTPSARPTTITYTPYTSYHFIDPKSPGAPSDAGDENELLYTAGLGFWTLKENVRHVIRIVHTAP